MSMEYLRKLLLRYWWFLILCVILAEGGVLLGSRFLPVATSKYPATARLRFMNSSVVSDRVVGTVVQTATSPEVLDQVLARYPDLTEDALRGEVSVTTEVSTLFLNI